MLSTKKLIYKILTHIKSNGDMVFLTQSGTTTAQGSVELTSANRLTDNVVWVRATNYNNALCIPWRYGNANGFWYVKVLDWQNMSVVANTNMNLEICVIRKSS